MTELQLQRSISAVPVGRAGLSLTSLKEMLDFAKLMVDSGFAPKGKTPGQLVGAIQYGAEIGVGPMQAMSNIELINGRSCMWGDLLGALIRQSALLEEERPVWSENDKDGTRCDFCVRRKYQTGLIELDGAVWTHIGVFSVREAKAAGLWGKSGPWTTYPKRMIFQRARTFAYRDAFSDVLHGLTAREEAMDIPGDSKTLDLKVAFEKAGAFRDVTPESATTRQLRSPQVESSDLVPPGEIHEAVEERPPIVVASVPPPPTMANSLMGRMRTTSRKNRMIEKIMGLQTEIAEYTDVDERYTPAELESKTDAEIEDIGRTLKDFLGSVKPK